MNIERRKDSAALGAQPGGRAPRRRPWAWLPGVFMSLAVTFGSVPGAHAAICLTCPEPPPPQPTPKPPSVSYPDAMMQFSQCLPFGVGPYLAAGVKAAIKSTLRSLDLKHDDPAPAPDVRTECIASTGRQTVAIWFEPVGSYGSWDTNAKRDAAIPSINILAAGEQFALRFRSQGIDRLVGVAWDDVDKRMNLSGEPDPDGSIRLSNYKVKYYSSVPLLPGARRVKLTVNGYVHSPFADVDFWGWATDTMRVAGGRITCSTSTGFDMEDSLEEAAADLFADPAQMVSKVLKKGPGCRIAEAMPTEVMLPKPPGSPEGTGLKEVFTYQRLVVNSTGITAGGVHETRLRTPSAYISGPSIVRGDFGDEAIGTFRAVTSDLRPPLTVTWTSQNAIITGNTTAKARWSIPGASLNTLYSRWLHAVITDADGVVRGANKAVKVKYVLDSSLPPICDTHPERYECN